MDQKKIGLFIATCRKKKGLTQKQLAEKLSVTDKSVSKWERGIHLPDASLYIPLCEILGITISEFFLGEYETEHPGGCCEYSSDEKDTDVWSVSTDTDQPI